MGREESEGERERKVGGRVEFGRGQIDETFKSTGLSHGTFS